MLRIAVLVLGLGWTSGKGAWWIPRSLLYLCSPRCLCLAVARYPGVSRRCRPAVSVVSRVAGCGNSSCLPARSLGGQLAAGLPPRSDVVDFCVVSVSVPRAADDHVCVCGGVHLRLRASCRTSTGNSVAVVPSVRSGLASRSPSSCPFASLPSHPSMQVRSHVCDEWRVGKGDVFCGRCMLPCRFPFCVCTRGLSLSLSLSLSFSSVLLSDSATRARQGSSPVVHPFFHPTLFSPGLSSV